MESGERKVAIVPQMLSIERGEFLMGIGDDQIDWLVKHTIWANEWLKKDGFERERPQHKVCLDRYWIARYPVTVGEYQRFILAGGYAESDYWSSAGWQWCESLGRSEPDYWKDEVWTSDDRLPVVGVSWYEATAYCRWLSNVSGRIFHLPSEAQWEKAARGGDMRLLPWGNQLMGECCNTRSGGVGQTTYVGKYSPGGDSPYGCADMIGNVSEWTSSRFLQYPYMADDGRENPDRDYERVTRGGSWHSPDFRARTTARGMNDPFFCDNDLGFRCASISP